MLPPPFVYLESAVQEFQTIPPMSVAKPVIPCPPTPDLLLFGSFLNP